MTAGDVGISFGLGLMSSLHCVQMCGPVVLAYSMASPGARLGAHMAYNCGRVGTYAALGAIGGGVAQIAGIERNLMFVSGTAMMIAGVLIAGLWRRPQLVRIGGGLPRGFSRAAGRLLQSSSASSKLLLGLLMGLMPCGLVYAALLKSVSAGTAAAGALSMVAFGAGTAGPLIAMGLFSSWIGARLGRYANAVAAVSVFVVGAFLLWRGLHAPTGTGACHHAG